MTDNRTTMRVRPEDLELLDEIAKRTDLDRRTPYYDVVNMIAVAFLDRNFEDTNIEVEQ